MKIRLHKQRSLVSDGYTIVQLNMNSFDLPPKPAVL